MRPAAQLTAEGEAAWLRLKTHLEWCDGFALVYLFSDQPGVIEVFRERLADIHRARVTRLRQYEPRAPQDLIPGLLLRLLEPTSGELHQASPLWADLSQHAGADWGQARLGLLARLNEQRERLRTRQPRPVVLVLPVAERAESVAIAPDLWSIRQFTLTTGPWLRAAPATGPATHPAVSLPQPFPLSAQEQAQLQEWRRVHRHAAADRGALRAGWAAWQGLQDKRQLPKAEVVAGQALALARGLAAQGETPEALRDLSVSLNNVGKTAQALGRWDEARAAFEESLAISRQILQRIGETPEALRDLSVSLDNVGNTAQALGRWDEARAAFEEGLRIGERLAEALPEAPDYAGFPGHFRARLAGLGALSRTPDG